MDLDAFYREDSTSWNDLLTRFDRLDDRLWGSTGAAGEWTPKDVLAHISGWFRHLAELLAIYGRGLDKREAFDAARIDSMNAEFVERYRSWDPLSVRMLARDEHARAIVGIRSASFRGYDAGWEATIRANTTEHYDEHRPLLDEFLKEKQ
jgi:hypothetical protein